VDAATRRALPWTLRRGGRCRGRRDEEENWVPVTKLGRLVYADKMKSLEQIYLHLLPIKEHQIHGFGF
jgi:small subunit ribosomal protein S2e